MLTIFFKSCIFLLSVWLSKTVRQRLIDGQLSVAFPNCCPLDFLPALGNVEISYRRWEIYSWKYFPIPKFLFMTNLFKEKNFFLECCDFVNFVYIGWKNYLIFLPKEKTALKLTMITALKLRFVSRFRFCIFPCFRNRWKLRSLGGKSRWWIRHWRSR